MKNYIVRNCPCYDHDYEECLNTFRDEYKKCYDITDCLLKRIVEKCKEETRNDPWSESRAFAEDILKLLEIEEVDD